MGVHAGVNEDKNDEEPDMAGQTGGNKEREGNVDEWTLDEGDGGGDMEVDKDDDVVEVDPAEDPFEQRHIST